MPTQEETNNLEVIGEYFAEFWGKGNPDIVDKLCPDNFVINYPMHGPRYGKENAKKMLSRSSRSGPYVVGRWIGGGTHTGVAFDDLEVGALEQANTGKKIYFSGTTIFTLEGGLIVDETGEEGALTALQQLGLVQQPNPGKEVKYLHE
ncbi:hypothetical protein CDV31_010635 [Fusarium ambrosium]|uniref:SnoaL-like domain-containing protein n=1 Tax=Fusarium ambrosium TaxID=131363 RepID=A0A428TMC9_9HYPO|nr:hypothetical protein CDV31_010635 [Fusarium ambrosium]